MIESLMALSSELRTAAESARPIRTGPADKKLRQARRCYDHLAGEAGVAIAEALQRRGWLQLDADGGLLSAEGRAALAAAGLPLDLPEGAILCRPCLDWSERRPHLGGALGRALYEAMAARGWLRQSPTGRAVDLTPNGRHGLDKALGLALST
jgi:ribosomal protein S19E (S16A)